MPPTISTANPSRQGPRRGLHTPRSGSCGYNALVSAPSTLSGVLAAAALPPVVAGSPICPDRGYLAAADGGVAAASRADKRDTPIAMRRLALDCGAWSRLLGRRGAIAGRRRRQSLCPKVVGPGEMAGRRRALSGARGEFVLARAAAAARCPLRNRTPSIPSHRLASSTRRGGKKQDWQLHLLSAMISFFRVVATQGAWARGDHRHLLVAAPCLDTYMQKKKKQSMPWDISVADIHILDRQYTVIPASLQHASS